jgi:hypothetical protein
MPPEAIVRARLRDELIASAREPSEAVYEFWVPRSNERADLVVIGSHMSAFEIKTEHDTLKRLPRQVSVYARLFDQFTVVVADSHVAATMEMLPEWWGVIVIVNDDRQLSFRLMRSASSNQRVDPETLVRLLWRDEVRAALSALGCEADSRASRSWMWQCLLSLVDLDRLKEAVRDAVLRRDPGLARIPTSRYRATESSAELVYHKAEVVR